MVFEEIASRDLASCNAMLNALCLAGVLAVAGTFFLRADGGEGRGVLPTIAWTKLLEEWLTR
jgi:hypothetical protein